VAGPATIDVETPQGRAEVELHAVERPRAALLLGHGAGGGIGARDLVAATGAARSHDVAVALVVQPYRVAGRRSTPRPPQLDEAWTAVVEQLAAGPLRDLRLISGGRSSGARVACRTAASTGAIAVLCLAFPLQPPRREGSTPAPSRLVELDAVAVPTLVVQGVSDRFGMPPAGAQRTVAQVPGDHALRNGAAVAEAVNAWLPGVLDALRD
jgi:predicted alpha/beta-hydrolase family hydrolase